MIPSLKEWPNTAKEATSPHKVRLTPLDTKPVFLCKLSSYSHLLVFIHMGLLKLNKINLLFDMYLEHSPFVSRNLGNLSFSHHIWDLQYKLFRLIFGLFLLFLDLNSITFTTSSTLPVFLRGWDFQESK